MNELALFAGAGGGILAGELLGWRTVCAVERDAYCAAILAQRQTDGCLPLFPIWSDVETFDGSRWRGIVDVVSGGFPCQDISVAGCGLGLDGPDSGLWTHMVRIIRDVRPWLAWVENSPALTSRGLGRVLGDLAELGFDASWGVLGAADVGAPTFAEESGLLLPTPTTIDSGSRFNRSPSEGALLRPTLGAMARYNLWPTPTVKGNYNRKGVSAKSGDGLATAVRRFPTPTVAMSRGSSSGALTRNSGRSRENDRLDYAIEGAALHGRLNPEFVEWLMGWPSGWSDSRRLEMARFREWRQQHGNTSPDP